MSFIKKGEVLSDLIIRLLLLSVFCIFAFFAHAQSKSLSGTVTDQKGEILVGVNVIVEGTTAGTISNKTGKWTLSLPKNATELKFTSIGYTDKIVKIGSGNTIHVVLSELSNQIDELVVVGYGTVKKTDLTGSVSTVKAEAIVRKPVANVAQALQGLSPGLLVTSNSGSPGGTVSVRIRGIGTVNDPSPLYVVDGLPVNDIAFLSSSEIGSIEILKDASATAIYGSRGANGVIMITTKLGVEGKDVITLDSYYGTSRINTNTHLLSGQQWYDIQSAINTTRLTPINLANADPSVSTNWLKEISQVGTIQSHNVSFSGGVKDFTYNLNLGYLDQKGTIKNTDYDRVNARINLKRKMNKIITVGTNTSVSNSSRNKILENNYTFGAINNALVVEPVVPVYNSDGSYGYSKYSNNYNPVAAIAYTNSMEKNLTIIGNIYGIVEFTKRLNFRSSLGMNYNRYDSYDFKPTYYVSNAQSNSVSLVTRGYALTNNLVSENTLNFNHTFNMNHVVDAMLGFTAEQTRYENLIGSKANTPNDNLDMQYLDAASNSTSATANGTAYESALISYIGRINYSYDNKYLATATIRRDGSSRFNKSNQYGNFPSMAVAWKVNNETFFKNWNQHIINTAKVRVGWGIVGNQNIANYAYQSLLTSSSQYAYLFGLPETLYQGIAAVALGNANIKWESTESTNIGIDVSYLDNKLTLSADYYNRTTNDMLLVEPIPYFLGFETGPTTNVGSVNNNGLEVQIEWKDKIGESFNYSIGGNISTINNKVLSLGTGTAVAGYAIRNGYTSYTKVGTPIGAFWGYKTNGLVQTQEELQDVITRQPYADLGDVIFDDTDGNGVLNDLDKTLIGNPIPKFYYGFTVNMEYKGIDLSANFEGSYGNDIFNAMRYYTYSEADVTQKSVDVLNYWTPTNTNTNMPRLNGNDKNDNLRISDRYIEDGSYLRLKTLQVGYSLPQAIAQKIFMSSMRIYISSNNLLTFTNYSGSDPEIGQLTSDNTLSKGVDIGAYPQAKTVVAGINITF
ncbi:MAG: TonB-dependent receptor [Paludibacter sp.]|nr:TonB-dependent receptor [Paludibacter sp.]